MPKARQDWTVEGLSSTHEVDGFDCGEVALNDYLVNRAISEASRGLSQTYVAIRGESVRVLGYYTVSAGAVAKDTTTSKAHGGAPYGTIPCVHLGRLAVDKREQDRGLGEHLLMSALALSERAAQKIGIRLVEVVALHKKARQFYLKYSFHPLKDDPNHLYMTMSRIERLDLNKSEAG